MNNNSFWSKFKQQPPDTSLVYTESTHTAAGSGEVRLPFLK